MKKAFTLIELLVVIAIIAILAAILFPVFAQAKEAAKKTQSLAQMKQLAAVMIMYAGDNDDYMAMSTNYNVPTTSNERIWVTVIMPYVKNQNIFVAPGSTNSKAATGWGDRNGQSVGYNGATAVDDAGCIEGQADTTGCEGFTTAVNFNKAEETALVPLFAVTPNGPLANKYRGYTFSPYNGPRNMTNVKWSIPLVADVDLVEQLGGSLSPAQLKPVFCRYSATGKGDGVTPIVFADGHVKTYSANAINGMGTGILWRFR